jgi:hypothetical protein
MKPMANFLIVATFITVPAMCVHFARNSASVEDALIIAGLDIGDLMVTDRYIHTVEICNKGPTHLQIIDIRTSCSCVAVNPTHFSLPPKGSITVTLELDLRPRLTEIPAAAKRELFVDLFPIVAGVRSQPTPSRLTGTVRNPFAITRSDFTSHMPIIRESGDYNRIFTFAAWEELRDLQAVSDDTIVLTEADGGTPSDSLWRYRVALQVNPTTAAGLYTLPIKLKASIGDKAEHSQMTVNIPLEIVEDVQCTPQMVMIGALPVDDSFAADVMLTSQTSSGFVIVHLDPSSDLSVYPLSEPHCYRIEGRVTQAGAKMSSVTFHVRQASGRIYQLPLVVSSVGLSLDR